MTAGVSLPTFFGPFLGLCLLLFARLGAVAAWTAGHPVFVTPARDRILHHRQSARRRPGNLWGLGGAAYLARRHFGPVRARADRAYDPGRHARALASDFVRTARASGLSRRVVLATNAIRNAAPPVLTTLGMVFSFLLGANVLVEKVFSWPGIGSFAIEALVASDYAAVQGFVLAMALLFVCVNLAIDVILTLTDPRVGLDD